MKSLSIGMNTISLNVTVLSDKHSTCISMEKHAFQDVRCRGRIAHSVNGCGKQFGAVIYNKVTEFVYTISAMFVLPNVHLFAYKSYIFM